MRVWIAHISRLQSTCIVLKFRLAERPKRFQAQRSCQTACPDGSFFGPWAMSGEKKSTAYGVLPKRCLCSSILYGVRDLEDIRRTEDESCYFSRATARFGADKLHNPVSVVDVTPATEEMKACCAIRGNARK
ncbi:hypothetical protein CPSG_07366 [Coccidioides posadasii str. Silveira]|uniref:Uncharacterized protein n=2 Tax=Coccidioides posadasii TaxID=199306 RepID=E9DC14_COCPS|nr:hypothetical protein CPSG_07366 [Coccidioides posadasii str. Silveira]KMM67832.1 hypothetical protein CPAG_04165 [Coccidioides posadasii RMSCC 3488]